MNETIKIMDKQQLFEQISGFYQTLEELESQTIQMMVERDVLNEKIYENKEQIESLEKLKLNK